MYTEADTPRLYPESLGVLHACRHADAPVLLYLFAVQPATAFLLSGDAWWCTRVRIRLFAWHKEDLHEALAKMQTYVTTHCSLPDPGTNGLLYNCSRQLLPLRRERGVRMAIASRTPTPSVARAFMAKLGTAPTHILYRSAIVHAAQLQKLVQGNQVIVRFDIRNGPNSGEFLLPVIQRSQPRLEDACITGYLTCK